MAIGFNSDQLKVLMRANVEILPITISKKEVMESDFSDVLVSLKGLISDPEISLYFREKVEISFVGFENSQFELWEIVEVRNYIMTLDNFFPYWLFFLSKSTMGLHCITYCFLLPFLTDEAQKKYHSEQLNNLFETRWMPAMYHICEFTGIDESEKNEMIVKQTNYLRLGFMS